MDTKGVQKGLGNAKEFANRIIRLIWDKPRNIRLIVYPLKFVLGFLLAKGILFGGYAPFGLSYAAALGGTGGAAFGIVGVILGYFSIIHVANGLKYVACSILIYTASFVFRETRLVKTRWFMPVSALAAAGFVGIVFVADSGFKLTDIMLYISELIFVSAGAYLYQLILNPERGLKESIETQPLKYFAGLLVILSSLLIPLSAFTIFKTVSLGHTLAVFVVMLTSYFGGLGIGSCVGVILGLSIGIFESTAYYSAIYGFSGIAAGIFRKKGKTLFSIVYLISNVSVMLWLTNRVSIPMLYGAFFACVLFLVTSEVFEDRLIKIFAISRTWDTSKEHRVRAHASERLKAVAAAFNDLSSMLGSVSRGAPKTNDNDVAGIYDRAASLICRKCVLSNACWEKEFLSTKDALNSVTRVMLERGRLEASDFPLHFSSRCVMIREFIAAINQELNAYLYRKQYKNRIAESQSIMHSQYRQVSRIFAGMAGDIESEPVFEEKMEYLIGRVLKSKQITADVFVYRDCAAHLHLHIEGLSLEKISGDINAYITEFSDIMGVGLAAPLMHTIGAKQVIALREAEQLCATMGVAVNKKSNSDISGDSGSYFMLSSGKLCVILSDGMGSGKNAAAESAVSVGMLEKLIRSGIEPKSALMTIHSALSLRSEQTGGFSTLDLMCADMYNGETLIYKLGGAPTYIKHGGQVRRVTSNALPAGVLCGRISDIEETRIKLCHEDYIVMASDGVADKNDDAWLREHLAEYTDSNPKRLAGELLAQAYAKYGRSDDMTVIVISIRQAGQTQVVRKNEQ